MIVVFGFSTAGFLIFESFREWEEFPFSTSEETVTIDRIDFPTVTVCPPKGSHTALNLDLKNSALSNEMRQNLTKFANETVVDREGFEIMTDNLAFLETNKYANWYNGISLMSLVSETIDVGESILQNFANYRSNPERSFFVYTQGFDASSFASSGSFQTPWFKKQFNEEIFLPKVDYKFSINIPEMRKDTFLVLKLDFDLKETKGGREEIVLQEPIGVNDIPKSKS